MHPGHPSPPSLLLSSTSSPAASQHPPSNTPFRHIPLQEESDTVSQQIVDHPLSDPSRNPGRLSPVPSSPARCQGSRIVAHAPRSVGCSGPPPLPAPFRGRPQGFRIPERLKPWLGIGSWAVTSIGFLLAIAFWKKEVFTGAPACRTAHARLTTQRRSRPTIAASAVSRPSGLCYPVLFNLPDHDP